MTREQIAVEVKKFEDDEGRIVADDIVVAAEADIAHPLREQFEWDNKVAGHSFRVIQARRLIRMVRFEVAQLTPKRYVPFYVRDPERPPKEQGYRSIVALKADINDARAALSLDLGKALGLLQRSREVAKGLDLTDELEQLLSNILTFQARLQSP